MWDKLKGAVAGFGDKMKNLAKNVGQWIKDNADVINRVCDVIGDIGAGLQIVGIFLAATGIGAPLGGVLLGAGSIMSGVALAGHATTLAVGGGGSWKEWGPRLAGDALGVFPGVGAVGKGAVSGAKLIFKGGAKAAFKAGTKQSLIDTARSGGIFGAGLSKLPKVGGAMRSSVTVLRGGEKFVEHTLTKTGLATLEGIKIAAKIPHIKEYWAPQSPIAGITGPVGNAFYNAVAGAK
jgi:hypothetical protein